MFFTVLAAALDRAAGHQRDINLTQNAQRPGPSHKETTRAAVQFSRWSADRLGGLGRVVRTMQVREERCGIFHTIVARVERHRLVVRCFDTELAVLRHTCASWNQLAENDVLLEANEVVCAAIDGSLGEHTSCLLERGSLQPRLGCQRCLGDAHQLRTAFGRTQRLFDHATVRVAEALGVDTLAWQEA